jgi:hypothetical protein
MRDFLSCRMAAPLSFHSNVSADPKALGQTVGKAKRVRAILSTALDAAPDKGELLTAALIALVRAKGGFRETSPNFVGKEAIVDAN